MELELTTLGLSLMFCPLHQPGTPQVVLFGYNCYDVNPWFRILPGFSSHGDCGSMAHPGPPGPAHALMLTTILMSSGVLPQSSLGSRPVDLLANFEHSKLLLQGLSAYNSFCLKHLSSGVSVALLLLLIPPRPQLHTHCITKASQDSMSDVLRELCAYILFNVLLTAYHCKIVCLFMGVRTLYYSLLYPERLKSPWHVV